MGKFLCFLNERDMIVLLNKLNNGMRLASFSNCLATIGVAFLSAVTSVAALFYYIKKEGNDDERI